MFIKTPDDTRNVFKDLLFLNLNNMYLLKIIVIWIYRLRTRRIIDQLSNYPRRFVVPCVSGYIV